MILCIGSNNRAYPFTFQADEIKAADENARRAADDCQHLQDELRKAQTEANNMDKMRRNLSSQVKDLQGRLDESEAARAGAGKRQIANLELRVICSSQFAKETFPYFYHNYFSQDLLSKCHHSVQYDLISQ